MAGGDGDDVLTGTTARDDLQGGAGNDTLTAGDYYDSLVGGDGDDRLDGGASQDELLGDAGHDVLQGGGDADRLMGGDGDDSLDGGDGDLDQLDGGNGADDLRGGPGLHDEGGYSIMLSGTRMQRTAPVTVTLDGRPNDGEAGERDNVGSDLEDVYGGGGNDLLIGDKRTNHLYGRGGHDVLVGGGGQGDWLLAESGSDTIYSLDGGVSEPRSYPQIPILLNHEPADDAVTCTSGTDTAIIDADDDRKTFFPIRDDCERVFVADALTTVAPDAQGTLPIGLGCPSELGTVCVNDLTVTLATRRPRSVGYVRNPRGLLQPRRALRLGQGVYEIRSGRRRVVRVRLSKRGRRLVGSRRRIGAWITLRR